MSFELAAHVGPPADEMVLARARLDALAREIEAFARTGDAGPLVRAARAVLDSGEVLLARPELVMARAMCELGQQFTPDQTMVDMGTVRPEDG